MLQNSRCGVTTSRAWGAVACALFMQQSRLKTWRSDVRQCTFLLNGEKMSLLNLGGLSFHAFSGLGVHVNQRSSSCVLNQGPIPVGSYYVTDRQSGGRLGWLYDSIGGMDQWFALYADKERIDDEV